MHCGEISKYEQILVSKAYMYIIIQILFLKNTYKYLESRKYF